jgi:hypothetical protein
MMIEVIKVTNAAINFGSLILISYFFEKEILFFFISVNSLSFIIALVLDRGLSHFNSYAALEESIFFSSKSKLHSKNFSTLLVIGFVFSILYLLIFAPVYNLILISFFLSLPSLIFLRWRLTKVRDGYYEKAALYSEFFPTACKFLLIPILFYNTEVYFLTFFIIQFILIKLTLKKYPIKNILTFFPVRYLTSRGEKPYINFLFGMSGGIKNFGIGAILSLIEPIAAASLFLANRISQLGVISMSGIFSRIPSKLINNMNIFSNNSISILAFINFIFFSFLIIFQNELFELFNLIFNNVNSNNGIENLIYILILSPVLINFYAQLFLALGKTKISLALDCFYIIFLSTSLLYYGYF